MYSNPNYAQTQKYLSNQANRVQDNMDESEIQCQTAKNASRFMDNHSVAQDYDKVRMLDSRMTENELFIDHSREETSKREGRNATKNEHIIPNSLLNNSYDDIKHRNKYKKVTATYRKDLAHSVKPLKNSARNKTHRKQRSISMNSNRKHKQSVLRGNRISDTISDKSTGRKNRDHNLSMSLYQEKNELRDTMKHLKYEDKYKDAHSKLDTLKNKLAKERKKTYEQHKTIELLEKKIEKSDKYVKKVKVIKKDYNDLLDSFEKSEQIRKGQKELILALRAENARLKKKIPNQFVEGEEKPKRTKSKKKKSSKESTKSTTRRKSKKPSKCLRT
jgi:hypothetical protein